jgi:predicted flavoprotein YhiN
LDASHLATRTSGSEAAHQDLRVQWTEWDRTAWDRALIDGKGRVVSLLNRRMPARLAAQLLAEARIPVELAVAQLDRESRSRLVALLTDYPLPWAGNEGYRKAEVTGGGVPLSEIDPATMESRVCRRLFLCGEILDAFGPIGGHNFLWAWTTGRAAGLGAAAVLLRGAGTV